jgi:hypothetical protein
VGTPSKTHGFLLPYFSARPWETQNPTASCIFTQAGTEERLADSYDASRGEDVKAYEQLARSETIEEIWRAAQSALALYGIEGARVSVANGQQDLLSLEVPAEHGRRVHPYLGRIDGKRFVLSVHQGHAEGALWARAELEWLLALSRETDALVPEPVPACDGSLVAQVSYENDQEVAYCLLLRWMGDPILDPTLHPQMPGEEFDPPARPSNYDERLGRRRPWFAWVAAAARHNMEDYRA